MRYNLKLFYALCFILGPVSVIAQELFLPLNNQFLNRYEYHLNRTGSDFHTDVKPYRESEVRAHANVDSIDQSFYSKSFDVQGNSFLYRKLRSESFVHLKNNFFDVRIDPFININQTHDFSNGDFGFVHTGGLTIKGTIQKSFAFHAQYSESETSFLSYIDSTIAKHGVVPGQGASKTYLPNGGKYHLGDFVGYLSFTPSKHFNFQFGNDKNFFGDGYRSLLLSDNANAYPFFKITTSVWKIKYVNLYTSMTDAIYPNTTFNADQYKRKNVAMHYLSYNIFKRVTISLFEAVVFRAKDSTSYRGYDWNYLNPVIFLRPQEFYLSSSDNSLMGLNLKIKISEHLVLYGQLLLDEFKLSEVRAGTGWYANKHAVQFGYKFSDFLKIKNLQWRAEFNYVRPFTYSHYNTLQSYTHYGQALAHPVGANFWEALSHFNYRKRSVVFEMKISTLLYGEELYNDSTMVYDNYGKDVFRSYLDHPPGTYGYHVGNGNKTTVIHVNLNIGYVLNPKTNLMLEGGIQFRAFENSFSSLKRSSIIHIALKTNLNNLYYDF